MLPRRVVCVLCESHEGIVSVKIPAVFRYLVMEMLAANANISFAVEAIAALSPTQLTSIVAADANEDDDDVKHEDDSDEEAY